MREYAWSKTIVLTLAFGLVLAAALAAPSMAAAEDGAGEPALIASAPVTAGPTSDTPPKPIVVLLFGTGLAALSLAAAVQPKED